MAEHAEPGSVPVEQKTSIESRDSEFFYAGLTLGILREDFRIKAPEDEVNLVDSSLRNGRLVYLDPSFAKLIGLEIQDKREIKKGEKLAIVPTDIAPSGPGRISVIPYSWHIKELEKYKQSGIKPEGLMFVTVPENLVEETNPNSLEPKTTSGTV